MTNEHSIRLEQLTSDLIAEYLAPYGGLPVPDSKQRRIRGIAARIYNLGRDAGCAEYEESPGCSCCQARSGHGTWTECPRCDHLARSHGGNEP